jgi:predicted aldo/keto reductase-like oxidoreductase
MRLPTLGSDDNIDIERVKEMVDAYINAGHNYFDTAYMYHGGKSEIAVREAVVKRHKRENFVLVDKMPIWSVEKKRKMLTRYLTNNWKNVELHILTYIYFML